MWVSLIEKAYLKVYEKISLRRQLLAVFLKKFKRATLTSCLLEKISVYFLSETLRVYVRLHKYITQHTYSLISVFQ